MALPMLIQFLGGDEGAYLVQAQRAIAGEPLPAVKHVSVVQQALPLTAASGGFCLRGVTSHQRYAERSEGERLRATQAALGRPEASVAALIPIKKSEAWWELAQDERRAIFELRSRHIADTLKYLPAIARRLHHARDLGEPFDFVTWFELAPQHEPLFDELLGMLRSTEEWQYVEREAELRLMLA
jgi:hypothetical protein